MDRLGTGRPRPPLLVAWCQLRHKQARGANVSPGAGQAVKLRAVVTGRVHVAGISSCACPPCCFVVRLAAEKQLPPSCQALHALRALWTDMRACDAVGLPHPQRP